MTVTLCICWFVLMVLAIPFWVTLGLGTVAILLSTGALPLTLLGEGLFEGVDSFALIAIPLFILTGDVMVAAGSPTACSTSPRRRSAAGARLRNLDGDGLRTLRCISGSDAADAAAIGRITMDRLQEKGYPKAYACALVASGACTGILIPPSIAYIVLGLVLGRPSSTLFQAAFLPGVHGTDRVMSPTPSSTGCAATRIAGAPFSFTAGSRR